MSDPYDINKLIAESKAANPLNDPNIPLLGHQVPVMSGLEVNQEILTINEIEKLSERDFRELFLATIITLIGGMYAPAPPKDQLANSSNLDSVDSEATN